MNLSSVGIQSSALAQFFDQFKSSQSERCLSCKYVLRSESSETSLRCGYGYYQVAPSERKAIRMDRYFVVSADESCYNWRNHTVSVLTEKMSQATRQPAFQ